jgi:hypothetical protein
MVTFYSSTVLHVLITLGCFFECYSWLQMQHARYRYKKEWGPLYYLGSSLWLENVLYGAKAT